MLTVSEAQERLHAGTLSCVEMVERVCDRMDVTEAAVHAYVHERREAALEEASAADARLRAGAPPRALEGMPFAVKDVMATHDLPTEAGARLLQGHRPSKDAVVVARARAAGAILVGKHASHELAMGQDVPPTRSPWHLEHYPGGSSAGGGVSVSVGSSLFAFGTDAGGSVRKPAALNGVVGLKPTRGRVSLRGVLALASAESLDHVGIFARTARDARIVLGVAGDVGHAAPIMRAGTVRRADGDGGPLAGVRIAVDWGYVGQTAPGIAPLFERALTDLESLGAETLDVRLAHLSDTLAAELTILLAEVGAKHAHLLSRHPDAYGDATRQALQAGALLPAAWVGRARCARRRLSREVAEVFSLHRLDLLASPTVCRPSMAQSDMDPGRDLPELIRLTAPWNLTGQPAVSVPCGLTDAGLPVGLQLVGRPGRDGQVLGVAESYQRVTDWHEHEPPLFAGAAP